jgi:type II secretory pathway component PulF
MQLVHTLHLDSANLRACDPARVDKAARASLAVTSQVRVRPAEVGRFFQRLEVMLSSGVPLAPSILHLVEGESNLELKEAWAGCFATLMNGHPLSKGMKCYPGVFSRASVDLISVAENTGSLVAVCKQMALMYERKQRRQQQLLSAVSYPACLFLVMLFVVVVFVVAVVPGDQGIFAALGDNVPWPSQILQSAAAILTNPLLMMGLLAVLVGVGTSVSRAYKQQDEARLFFDRVLLAIPVVGHLIGRSESARAFETMTSCSRVGMGIVRAMRHAAVTCRNTKFRMDLQDATKAVSLGAGVGESLARHTVVPTVATSLVEVGEASGRMVEMLERSTVMLDTDVQDALDKVVALAEPALLTGGGLLAAFIALATFLPITNLISNF